MANATAITLTALTANSSTAAPTAQVLDTGSVAVTLKTSATSEADRIIMRVQNTAVANLTVSINAGDDPPAFRQGLGAYTTGNIAQNAEVYLGPFEAARFKQSDGTLEFTFTPASGTITANFDAFVLPKT